MNFGYSSLSMLLLCASTGSYGQKPFAEGTLRYKVKLETAAHKQYAGTYIFSFKGGEVKKELTLDNGYKDVVLINCNISKVYLLQEANGKKYAIELAMVDLLRKQQQYTGFSIANEVASGRNIAGMASARATVNYRSGPNAEVYYTKEWKPVNAPVFERFPDAEFLPLQYSYKDENGIVMYFEAESITPGPIENSVFRIPAGYMVISNTEYKQLVK